MQIMFKPAFVANYMPTNLETVALKSHIAVIDAELAKGAAHETEADAEFIGKLIAKRYGLAEHVTVVSLAHNMEGGR